MNLLLFLNTEVGYNVAKFLISDKKSIIKNVFLCGQYEIIDNRILNLFKETETKIYNKISNEDLDKIISSDKTILFIICVYWPYLLKKNILEKTTSTINFHPAFLPINRGWYPHVHSIIDDSVLGVTLHEISEGADKGDIWSQKKISIPENYTALDAYLILQKEIFKLFSEKWNLIRDNKIKAFPQDNSKSNYHKKSEIENLDFIDIEKDNNKSLIKKLRARSFGKKGFAYFIDSDGQKIYLNLRLSKTNKFE